MTEPRHEEADVVTTTLAVTGMTCGACERHVLKAIDGVTGVIHVAVDLQNGRAIVEHVPALVDAASFVMAVRDAGYQARVVQTGADTGLVAPPIAARTACGCGCGPPATTRAPRRPGA